MICRNLPLRRREFRGSSTSSRCCKDRSAAFHTRVPCGRCKVEARGSNSWRLGWIRNLHARHSRAANQRSRCANPGRTHRSKGLGIMPARAETIRRVAQLLCEEPTLLTGAWPSEEARARLVGIRGIGPWTASYIALRALGDPDAYLEKDLGLMQALAGWGDGVANAWRPWRGYAVIRIWTLPQSSVMNKASSGTA